CATTRTPARRRPPPADGRDRGGPTGSSPHVRRASTLPRWASTPPRRFVAPAPMGTESSRAAPRTCTLSARRARSLVRDDEQYQQHREPCDGDEGPLEPCDRDGPCARDERRGADGRAHP